MVADNQLAVKTIPAIADTYAASVRFLEISVVPTYEILPVSGVAVGLRSAHN